MGSDASPTVLILRDAGDPERRDFEERLAALAAAAGLRVALAPDLYHAPEDSPAWDRLRSPGAPLVAAGWLHARATEWLLRRHGVGEDGLVALTLADCGTPEARPEATPEAALEAILAAGPVAPSPEGPSGTAAPEVLPGEAVSERWYPVVDRSRCTRCGHCLQFCLFSVYEAGEDGGPVVANPDNCKAGCPACARICPGSAIIFPLYTQDPAICGAPGQLVTVDAEAARMFRERVLSRKAPAPPEMLAEIDALIDELERMGGGGL